MYWIVVDTSSRCSAAKVKLLPLAGSVESGCLQLPGGKSETWLNRCPVPMPTLWSETRASAIGIGAAGIVAAIGAGMLNFPPCTVWATCHRHHRQERQCMHGNYADTIATVMQLLKL